MDENQTSTDQLENQDTPSLPEEKPEPVSEPTPITPSSFDYINKVSQKSSRFNKKTLLLILAGLALSGIIIGAVSASKKATSDLTESSPLPLSSPSSFASPSPKSSPKTDTEATDSADANDSDNSADSTNLDLADYSIKVLNGSGEKGEASSVRSLLITEGFAEVDTANADNYDYTDTEVSLKADVPNSIFDTIETVLGDTYTVLLDSDPLTDDSDYDVVIIVGQKQEE